MSADNWDVCPRCLDRAQGEAAEALENVMALYGNVPVDEFDAKRAALEEVDPEKYRTFREDYEIWGASEGRFDLSYSGACTTCGLKYEKKLDECFWTPEETP